MGEWNAWDVCRRWLSIDWLAKCCSNASMALVGPDTTQRFGSLRTAISISPNVSLPASKFSTCSTGSGTDSIDPVGSCCISRPRAATNARPSSRLNTPAKQAATYSPMLWPNMAPGCTPQESHNWAKAYSITNNAGWAMAVCLSCSVAVACASGWG